MNTTLSPKIATRVEAAFGKWKKAAIAEQLGMSYPTLRRRLKDNFWEASEIETLRKLGIL